MLGVGLLVLSLSGGMTPAEVELTVSLRDGATKRPVAGCLVAFEDPARGAGVTETDSKGIARGRVKRRDGGSPPWPWERDVTLDARFHLGDPRHETWSVNV